MRSYIFQNVLLVKKVIKPWNSCNSAFPFKEPPAVSEWIHRDIHVQPVCSFSLDKNRLNLYALR